MQEAIDTGMAPDEDVEKLLDDVEGFFLGNTTLAEVYGLSVQDVQDFAALADKQLEAGRTEDALTMYEGCVALNPTDVTILCGYGLTLQLAGQSERAKEVLSLARIVADGDPAVEEFLAAVS